MTIDSSKIPLFKLIISIIKKRFEKL